MLATAVRRAAPGVVARAVRVARAAFAAAVTRNDSGVVIIQYADLANGTNINAAVDEAFGLDGLGIIAVEGVPNLSSKRARLLPLSRRLAELPPNELAKLENEESFYAVGWSHGRESFNGKKDFAKGSFYANPSMDKVDVSDEMRKKHPSAYTPNIWPSALPDVEPAFKDLGRLVVSVGILLARQCDRFVRSRVPSFPEGLLEHTITTSNSCKARLLHYFDMKGQAEVDEDSWCGWHLDHGALTGLVPAMFIDQNMKETTAPEGSGLFIKPRLSETNVKVVVPKTALGFQIGESAQILSGGVLRATPHCVRAGRSNGITRETLAVFMQPSFDTVMHVPKGRTVADAGVKLFEDGMTFAQFGDAKFKDYY